MIYGRVIGSETEWGFATQMPDGEALEGKYVHPKFGTFGKILLQCSPDNLNYMQYGLNRAGGFSSNGGRDYEDIGGHPETATPECVTINEIMACEIGQEATMSEMCEKAKAKNIIGNYILTTDVVSNRGDIELDTLTEREIAGDYDEDEYNVNRLRDKSWGYHENVQAERRTFSNARDNPQPWIDLSAHLATRGVLTGAGGIICDRRGIQMYIVAQKAAGVHEAIGRDTVHTKPLINLRDEPHSDRSLYRRLHIVGGDRNISALSTRLRWGSLVMVVMARELGLPVDIQFADNTLHKIANIVSYDTTGKELLTMENGKTITALGVQSHYIEEGHKLKDMGLLTKELESILAQWVIAHDMSVEDPMLLTGKYDWQTRKAIVDRKARDPNNYNIEDLARCLQYGRIGTKASTGQLVRTKNSAQQDVVPSEELIAARRISAPNTRAADRARFIETYAERQKAGESFACDWGFVNFPGKAPLILPDPRLNNNSKLALAMSTI